MGLSRQEYWSGSHSLLQGNFLTQGSNPGLPCCRQILPSEPPGREGEGWAFWGLPLGCVCLWLSFLFVIPFSCFFRPRCQKLWVSQLVISVYIGYILWKYLFIWLCWVLVVARWIFSYSMWNLSFGLQDLVPFAAAAAKSLQSCLTLCNPIDGSPPGSPVPRILQARTLEWVAISFSNTWTWKVKVKSLSRVQLFETPWTAAYQAPPSLGFSRQEYWSGVPLPSPKDS